MFSHGFITTILSGLSVIGMLDGTLSRSARQVVMPVRMPKEGSNLALTLSGAKYSGRMPKTLDIPLTSAFTLQCSFTGSPQPNIYWSKDGVPILETVHDTASPGIAAISMVTSALNMECANATSAGRYECVGVNGFGNETLKVGTDVRIHENSFNALSTCQQQLPPTLVRRCKLPEISLWTDTVFMMKPSSTARLTCRAVGFPQPTIHWRKDGQPLVNGDDFSVLKNGDLIIKTVVPEFSIFTCIALNSCGESRHSVETTVFWESE